MEYYDVIANQPVVIDNLAAAALGPAVTDAELPPPRRNSPSCRLNANTHRATLVHGHNLRFASNTLLSPY
ncbi:hypothetical protein AAFF_G00381820 [Aldrovandia affinis]|uniref:Uncharacterized protein n=1 Tax=Aldrovandia affinis TaxID=143900 RepID=A0AAD7X0V5_9TELE|nr:hypothetical protein AAFF_G00381820 [Aldrovandia affinis]